MKTKKILGYIFIVLGCAFIVFFFTLIPLILTLIGGFVLLFQGQLDFLAAGYLVGGVLAFIIYITIIVFLFKYGKRWIKEQPAQVKKGTDS